MTLGDKTGTLKLFLKDDKFIKICKDNPYVEVLNAHSKFYKGFIQIEMDMWANINSCIDAALCKAQTEPVNVDNDLSAIEYELVPLEAKRSEDQAKKWGNNKNYNNNRKPEEAKAEEEPRPRGNGKRRGGGGRGGR